MGSYEDTFEWIDLPQGRARYVGQQRGREEPPIDVFSLEIESRPYYGEIRRSYLPDRSRYELEVVSFGWLKKDWLGNEPSSDACASFTRMQLEDIKTLFCQAVMKWIAMEDRPHILFTKQDFIGDVVFRNGWALLRDDRDET